VQVVYRYSELEIAGYADLPTGYNSSSVPGHIMSYDAYDLYSHELNKQDLQSTILVYKFEQITKKGGICPIMMSFSQPGFMRSKAQ